MTNLKNTSIIPLFDPKKWEKAAQCPHDTKLFPEEAKPGALERNWLPQDACGGHQRYLMSQESLEIFP